jgi:cardiolipin synthase
MTTPQFKSGHQVQLLEAGAEFFPALIGAIDASATEVRLETYIFHFEAAGEQVAQALERAALRGVSVFVVMDGIGTSQVPMDWVTRWTQAGVQWHLFLPLGRLGLLIPGRWRRMHRKLCVVDANIAFCGGINILDDYFDPNHGVLDSARLDYALRVQGPLVADVHGAVVQFWSRLQLTRQLEHLRFRAVPRPGVLSNTHGPLTSEMRADHSDNVFSDATAALVLRDNVLNRTRIEKTYRQAISQARKEVLIANAYFVPGTRLRRALRNAAKRGVRVRLLLQGRYEYFMQFHAARQVYGSLLAAGVEIHEYQAGFLHAKVAVVDGKWATVGSSNLEPLSLQLAREANVVVENPAMAQALQTHLEKVMQRASVQVNPQIYAERPWNQRMLDGLAFGAMWLILVLTGRRY